MAKRELVDLGLMLLDRQLLDSGGRRCGKVDDLEIEGAPGAEAKVSAIVSGPAAWSSGSRGPLAWLAARVAHADAVRIELDKVESGGAVIELRSSAEELGLGQGDDRAARWLRGLPGS
jgi:hypothetical protein